MSEIPKGLYYTKEHEYLKGTNQPGIYAVGITDYAQGELGDVVFLELPQAGDSFGAMERFGTIEAVKAVSDLYCPIAGEVVEAAGVDVVAAAVVLAGWVPLTPGSLPRRPGIWLMIELNGDVAGSEQVAVCNRRHSPEIRSRRR